MYRSQLHAIRQAKGYIFIQNAYFSDTTIIHELVKARLRGVDVRVIIPMEGNHGIMNASNVTAANTLLKYGVRVFTYPGMSHVKAAVYDGWACLGSANFDFLSASLQPEIVAVVRDAELVAAFQRRGMAPDLAARPTVPRCMQEHRSCDRTSFAGYIADSARYYLIVATV